MNKFKGGDFDKFLVVKKEDIINYLTEEEQENLRTLVNKVAIERFLAGKHPSNQYLVINTDEAYSGEIVDILKKNNHWGRKE